MDIELPDLTSKIEARINRNLNKVRGVAPAIVENVKREKMKIDVYVKTKWADDPTFIKNVRVVYPQSYNNKLLIGLERKDVVILLFSKFDMLSLQSEGLFDVTENPNWSKDDVVALPGVHIDQKLQEEYDESLVDGKEVKIPEGIQLVSENDIKISGNSVKFGSDVSLENNSLKNIGSLDWSSGESFPKIIESDTEPSLSSGAWSVWYDTSKDQMWLVVNKDGEQRKMELT